MRIQSICLASAKQSAKFFVGQGRAGEYEGYEDSFGFFDFTPNELPTVGKLLELLYHYQSSKMRKSLVSIATP